MQRRGHRACTQRRTNNEDRQPRRMLCCGRYYNDLWEFDTEELRWAPVETRGPVPAPRGGCQLALHHDTLFVLGGHSVLRDGTGERDKVHNDVHALDLKTLEVGFCPALPPAAAYTEHAVRQHPHKSGALPRRVHSRGRDLRSAAGRSSSLVKKMKRQLCAWAAVEQGEAGGHGPAA